MKNCKKEILRQTENGKVIKCSTCNQFHVEFNNLHFTFNEEEFKYFRNYFLELDTQYWEAVNADTLYSRKIMVPVGHKNITAMFQSSEVIELRRLFSASTSKPKYAPLLKFDTIRTGIIWN